MLPRRRLEQHGITSWRRQRKVALLDHDHPRDPLIRDRRGGIGKEGSNLTHSCNGGGEGVIVLLFRYFPNGPISRIVSGKVVLAARRGRRGRRPRALSGPGFKRGIHAGGGAGASDVPSPNRPVASIPGTQTITRGAAAVTDQT